MFADETGYPVLRFKRFTEKWEQVELNDIAPVTMGQSPNSKNYTENPNNYILVQGNADLFNGQVLPRIYTTQVTKVAHVGDILMSVRAPVGNIAQTQYDVVIGRGVAAISGNLFIKQLLNKMDKAGYWNKYIAGSTFESVNSNDIKSANIKVPKLEEQKKIGQLFQSLDKTITLHDKKIQYLKQLKRGLLQKMFV
ncbi:restriction endonuclease subunit S [Limosilactobacillus mucosae]